MTKMAVVRIYGKTLKVFFSGTKGPMTLKLGMRHWLLEYYQKSNFFPQKPQMGEWKWVQMVYVTWQR